MTSQVPNHETIHPRHGPLVAVSTCDDGDRGMKVGVIAFLFSVAGIGAALVLRAWLGEAGVGIGAAFALIAMVITLAVVYSRKRRYELYAGGFVERVGKRVILDTPLTSIVSLDAVEHLDESREATSDIVELVCAEGSYMLERCDAVELLAERTGRSLRLPRGGLAPPS